MKQYALPIWYLTKQSKGFKPCSYTMKKETFPNEPEENPVDPKRPEIEQPHDPRNPDIPQREVPDVPQELPQTPAQPNETPNPQPGPGF